MTAASNSESRKRRTVAADPVEIVARALGPVVPNSDGVLWMYDYADGQSQPVTLHDAAFEAVSALQAAGLLTPP